MTYYNASVRFLTLDNYVALAITLCAIVLLVWLLWPYPDDVFGTVEDAEYEDNDDEDLFEDLEVIFKELRTKLFCDLSPLKLISFEEDTSLQFSSSENLSEVLNFIETGLKSIGYENTHTLNLSTGCVTFKLTRLDRLELILNQSKETKGVFILSSK